MNVMVYENLEGLRGINRYVFATNEVMGEESKRPEKNVA